VRRPTPHPHRVLIVGGGFGGLYAAKALRRAPVEVTLVDRVNHHLFQPLLHQVSAGVLAESEIAPPLRGVLRRQANAQVLLAEITGFDLDRREAHALSPRGEPLTLPYDSLIVAAGASRSYFGRDEWAAVAPGLKTLADAREVRSRILRAFELAELADHPAERAAWLRFAVVGGGPAGIELAGQIAELAHGALRPDYRRIDTATAAISLLETGPDLLPCWPGELSARAEQDLGALGVDVRTHRTAVGLDEEGVDVVDPAGEPYRVPARTVLWAAGVAPSPLARALGAELDRAGRVLVRDDLTVPDREDVFAIGDMAALDGVPGIAPAAMQQGRHAARTIRRRLAGRGAPGPFRYRDKGSLAVIGHDRAVGVAFGVPVTGLGAMLIWALVHVRHLVGWGNRMTTTLRWLWTLLARDRAERVIAAPAPLPEIVSQRALA
jgi:NADH:ubiquinone reductase (H+-translocating)